MNKSVTQDMAYRQSLMKYATKFGVSKASRKYNKGRSYIYFWLARWDGSVESLTCQSRRPQRLFKALYLLAQLPVLLLQLFQPVRHAAGFAIPGSTVKIFLRWGVAFFVGVGYTVICKTDGSFPRGLVAVGAKEHIRLIFVKYDNPAVRRGCLRQIYARKAGCFRLAYARIAVFYQRVAFSIIFSSRGYR